MEDSNILWKKAQEFENAYKYSEAATAYIKAAKIDLKNDKKKDAATEFGCAGTCLYYIGELDEALKHYREALNLIQTQIKGKELDFKLGQISCPNCKQNIEIKFMGELAAVIETCPNPKCGVQFSFWMVDPNSSKCLISILSEEILQQGKITADRINLREQAGKETQTTISEWLHDGAIYTSNIAYCFKKKGDFLNACNYHFQAATMFMGLGFFERANNELKSLESLLPEILENDQEKYLHEIARLRKRTSESLRSREFTYIFVSCPNCNSEHQIRASATTIAIELCSKCRARFSVFYDNDTREFYTNLLEKPKVKVAIQKKGMEREEVRFCARCGLNVGTVVRFCVRCGLKILRI